MEIKNIVIKWEKHVCFFSLVLSLAGLFFTFIACFPGLMTSDSFDMWNMGIERHYSDWDAPLLSVIMLATSFLRSDPALYLFIQLSLMWSGIFIFSMALKAQQGRWPIVAVCLGYFPPILGLSGYLQKTPFQASCFLFVFSVLYYLYAKKRRIKLVAMIPLVFLLFIATVIRDYSYLSVLPILFFFYLVVKPEIALNVKKTAVIGCGLMLVLVVFYLAHHTIVYDLLKSEKRNKHYVLPSYELAGIYVNTGIPYAKEFLIVDDHETAKKIYEQNHGMWRIYRFYRDPKDDEEFRAILSELFRAVLENPMPALKHRLRAISGSFGISPATRTWNFVADYSRIKTNKYGITKSNNVFFRILKAYQLFFRKYMRFVLMPWFYAMTNIVLLIWFAVGLKKGNDLKTQRPHFLLLLSGFFFVIVFMLVCNANLNRYSYWLMVSTCFGGFGMISARHANVGGKGLKLSDISQLKEG